MYYSERPVAIINAVNVSKPDCLLLQSRPPALPCWDLTDVIHLPVSTWTEATVVGWNLLQMVLTSFDYVIELYTLASFLSGCPIHYCEGGYSLQLYLWICGFLLSVIRFALHNLQLCCLIHTHLGLLCLRHELTLLSSCPFRSLFIFFIPDFIW